MASKAVGIYYGLLTFKCLSPLKVFCKTPRPYKLTFLKRGTTCSIFTSAHDSQVQKDYYKILGISKNATSKEIREAYVQLVKKTHPDKYATSDPFEAGEDFISIQEAYEVLSDPKRRSKYDVEKDGYVRKNRTKQRYKASVKSWNRPSVQVPKSEGFRPDTVLENENDRIKPEEDRFTRAGDFMTFAYITIAAVVIVLIVSFMVI